MNIVIPADIHCADVAGIASVTHVAGCSGVPIRTSVATSHPAEQPIAVDNLAKVIAVYVNDIAVVDLPADVRACWCIKTVTLQVCDMVSVRVEETRH